MESNKNLSNLDIKVLSDIFHHLNEINQSCNLLRESFLNIAMAKVSESAYQAFGLGIFQKEKDYVVVENKRLLGIAKQEIINIANRGYTKPIKNKEIKESKNKRIHLMR